MQHCGEAQTPVGKSVASYDLHDSIDVFKELALTLPVIWVHANLVEEGELNQAAPNSSDDSLE